MRAPPEKKASQTKNTKKQKKTAGPSARQSTAVRFCFCWGGGGIKTFRRPCICFVVVVSKKKRKTFDTLATAMSLRVWTRKSPFSRMLRYPVRQKKGTLHTRPGGCFHILCLQCYTRTTFISKHMRTSSVPEQHGHMRRERGAVSGQGSKHTHTTTTTTTKGRTKLAPIHVQQQNAQDINEFAITENATNITYTYKTRRPSQPRQSTQPLPYISYHTSRCAANKPHKTLALHFTWSKLS